MHAVFTVKWIFQMLLCRRDTFLSIFSLLLRTHSLLGFCVKLNMKININIIEMATQKEGK